MGNSINSKILPLLKIIIIFVIVTITYNLIFVVPIKTSKKSLTEAKNLTTELKLINSQNILSFSNLAAINPSHPSYTNLIDDITGSVKDSDKRFDEVKDKYKDTKFGGNKTVKSYLNSDFRKAFEEALDTTSETYEKQKKHLENFIKINSILGNIAAYNPSADFYSLDLTDEAQKEVAAQKIEVAIEGIEKAKNKAPELSSDINDTLIKNINSSLETLKSFKTSLTASQRDKFIESYKSVSQTATEIIRESTMNKEMSSDIETWKKTISTLDKIITGIEIIQKEIPVDPLTRSAKK